MNTWTLSRNIPVFNVDGSPNEAGQISEVVNVVLRYKTHSERMLLAVSRLRKQNLILGYDWLKDHNPKIDWEKGEVEMTCCPLRCEGGHTLRKEQTCQKRTELRALRSCRDRPMPLLQEELELEEPLHNCMPPIGSLETSSSLRTSFWSSLRLTSERWLRPLSISRREPGVAKRHKPLPLRCPPTSRSSNPCSPKKTLTYCRSTASGIMPLN